MLVVVILLAVVAAALVGRWLIRRRRRAHEEATMYVPTVPSIELEQPYGGWDADPFDALTGHGAPRGKLIARSGPPSRWGWLP